MPSSLEPGVERYVVLECDKDKPNPPKFAVESLSMRDTRRLCAAYDASQSVETLSASSEKPFDDLFTILAELVTGWSNMGDFGEFEADKLWDVLTYGEARELALSILAGNYLTDDDKKKLD